MPHCGRPGDTATLFRFWMAVDAYQAVSAAQSLLFVEMVRHYLVTPRLVFTYLPCADPDRWRLMFDYADLMRLPQADFDIGGRRFGMYGHDWRVRPPAAWLDLLAEREMAPTGTVPPAPASPPLLVLSEPAFAAAVRDALRTYPRPDVLRDNPLLQSRVVVDRVGAKASPPARVTALRQLLDEATATLEGTTRSTKLHRALYHTYLQPAPSQERAAELLGLPFSTYRRHLREGVSHVTATLWRHEIGDSG